MRSLPIHYGLRSRARRFAPASLSTAVAASRNPDAILVDWVNRGPVAANWGDAVAPRIVEYLSGRPVVNRRDHHNLAGKVVYSTIGSMLGSVGAKNWQVWGSGFVDSRAELRIRPTAVHAVRGPLSRKKLIQQGVACPEVYGDPALLFPMLYRPQVSKKYRLGVIPHFKEYGMPSARAVSRAEGIKSIDITSGIWSVVEEINMCERIVSGSLHGLVAGHAYGIPSMWVRFSDRPAGDGFKFRDYLASVGTSDYEPLEISESTPIGQLLDLFEDYAVGLDLGPFLAACPFLRPGLAEIELPRIAV